MEDEPFVKESGWKRHFTEVTPFSKYLALALFVALPFIGFFLGVKYESVRVVVYEPTIVERVFEKEIIVDKGSTSTPEVRIIIFSGVVREGGQSSCQVDGVCSTIVSEYEVIWAEGWNAKPQGTKEVVYPGDRVEVFGQVIDEKTVTLYGNENYYLRKDKTSNLDIEPNQGVEKILRGQLMVYANENPTCELNSGSGGCFEEIIVFTNNSWEYRNWKGDYDEGFLSKDYIDSIVSEVAATDFSPLLSASICGSDVEEVDSYTFYSELGEINLDECQISKSNSLLFRNTVSDVLEKIYIEIES